MSLKQFLTSKIFLKQIFLALLITLILSWIVMFSLSIYTNRGEKIPTPDFSGKTIQEAQYLADKEDLRFVVKDSVYRKDTRPGTVLMQSPVAGHKIKSGRLVYLTISALFPEQVEVPKLTDVSMRQARGLLDSKGFALGNVEYHPSEFNDLVLDAKFVGQSILPGSKLDNGATIDLVVGKKLSDREAIVPDLAGLSLENAKTVLDANSLAIGMVLYDQSIVSSEDTLNARIIKQLPVADSTAFVPQGTSVDLWLGTGIIVPEQ